MRCLLIIIFLLRVHLLVAADTLLMHSPHKVLHTKLFAANGRLLYQVQAGNLLIVEPSRLGIQVSNRQLGTQVQQVAISSRYTTKETNVTRLNASHTIDEYTAYTISVQEPGITYTIEYRMYDNGCAFRYVLNGNEDRLVKQEFTSFTIPALSAVWYFERNSDWKLKSYAGLWQRTGIAELPSVSSQGAVQGKPLLIELPAGKYALITEAALYNYSGMRLKAAGNRVLSVNFTEGAAGFTVKGAFTTPWRVILYADDLNALVNNHVIENLNPQPDQSLFADQAYIKPGKSVWSWITRNEHYMEPAEELRFINAAAALHFEYSLIDEGWETKWHNKWAQLKALSDTAAQKNVHLWVWKHSDQLRDSVQRNGFLDSVAAAGAVGIKTDFMNSEAKGLIDFEEGLLKAAARRKLMVNFHGCHAPTGESKTYPNEMTREGIRGMELNIMKEPIPAWHNAALPFTRFICGHGDYTPGFFSNKANTTYTHQLALLYIFNSPFQCIAENPVRLLEEDIYQPILPLLQTLPVTWDETIVLPGSDIGKLAAFARRKGRNWYIAVINGTDSVRSFTLQPSFLKGKKAYKGTMIMDDAGQEGFAATQVKVGRQYKKQVMIPATGGMVLKLEHE